MPRINPEDHKSQMKQVDLPKNDTYLARVYSIVHKGTTVWMYWPQTQCQIKLELSTEKAVFSEEKWEQPFSVSINYINVAWSENSTLIWICKKLWINTLQPFDVEDLLWRPCTITVEQAESQWWYKYLKASHKDIWAIVKWTPVPELMNKKRLFWIDADYDIDRIDQVKENWEKITDSKWKVKQQKKINAINNIKMFWLDELTEYELEHLYKTMEYQDYNPNAVASDEVRFWEEEVSAKQEENQRKADIATQEEKDDLPF